MPWEVCTRIAAGLCLSGATTEGTWMGISTKMSLFYSNVDAVCPSHNLTFSVHDWFEILNKIMQEQFLSGAYLMLTKKKKKRQSQELAAE